MYRKPQLMEGGVALDERGRTSFVNGFRFENIRRFYIVQNHRVDTVRAWHGHLREEKYVYVAAGRAIVAAAGLAEDGRLDSNAEIFRYVMSSQEPQVLYLPAGMANGWRALEDGTRLIFFSTLSLEETKMDDFRFPHDFLGMEVWQA